MKEFALTEAEYAKAQEWMKEKELKYSGAIGGQFTFEFTPTSLGIIASVTDSMSMESITLTDFDNF